MMLDFFNNNPNYILGLVGLTFLTFIYFMLKVGERKSGNENPNKTKFNKYFDAFMFSLMILGLLTSGIIMILNMIVNS